MSFRKSLPASALIGTVMCGILLGAGANAASRDEIVVTSTREAVSQFDLAESTGVITSAEIDSLHPTHPADLLERVPGVHLVWLGGDHHTTAIRQPINFNPVYLYLENGVPTRSTGFFETNALFDVNLPQARRVEITKGPGTALYGSDAIAGIINVLTPLPPEEDGAFIGNASFQASTREYYQGLFSLAGRTGKHGLRADVNVVYDDGWRDNTESDRQLGTFTWTIDATDNLSVQNVLMLANVDQDSSGSNLSREDWLNNPRRNETPISFRLVDSARFHSIIEYRDGPQLFSLTPFFRYNRVRLLPFFALGFDPHYQDIEATSLGVQAKYRRDFGDDFRLIAGFDVDYSWGDRVDIAIDPMVEDGIAVDFAELGPVYDFSIDFISLSPYLHGEWQATERLRLIAGVRFDYAKYDYETALPADLSQDASHKRPPSQNVSFDDVSPKVGVVFDITERLNAYASYRRGFRIPTSSQLFRPFRNENSTLLNPVKADNFEIGLRGQPADWIDFEITAFHLTNKDDILVFTDNETGIRQIENSGKTRHQGIELGVNIQASPEWRISTNWTFSKHAFVRWRPVPGIDLSGNEINRAPERFGNTRVRYSPAWLEGGFIEAEWQHFGPYFLDDDNTRTYEGHDLFNLRIEVPVKQVRLFARLHNITDQRYATNGRFNRFAGEELKPGLPFTVFGGVSAGF